MAVCQKHDVLVISDEIHQDIILGDKPFVPAAVVSGGRYRDMVVTLNSASKTFNLATLLHSHIIITDDGLRGKYDQFASALNRTEVSIMGLVATKAGYTYGGEWLGQVLDVIRDNYRYLKEELDVYKRQVEERVKAVREAIGPNVDIIMENHSFLDAQSAVQIARRVEQYNICLLYTSRCV